MFLLPLLLSNLHLSQNAPLNPLDSAVGFRSYLPQPEELIPRIFDRYYPVTYDHGVLDFWFRPWLLHPKQLIDSTVSIDNDTFKMTMNVKQYKPEEVTVKVMDCSLVIEAKHEEKQDDKIIVSRQFMRRYLLPARVDVDQVTSTISTDGILTITAPLKPEEGKVIKVEQTGQPASNEEKEAGTSETNVDVEKKDVENNEVREEVTVTQPQEEGPKPEK